MVQTVSILSLDTVNSLLQFRVFKISAVAGKVRCRVGNWSTGCPQKFPREISVHLLMPPCTYRAATWGLTHPILRSLENLGSWFLISNPSEKSSWWRFFLKLVGMSIVGVEPLSTYHILFYQHLQFKDTMSIFDDFFSIKHKRQ